MAFQLNKRRGKVAKNLLCQFISDTYGCFDSLIYWFFFCTWKLFTIMNASRYFWHLITQENKIRSYPPPAQWLFNRHITVLYFKWLQEVPLLFCIPTVFPYHNLLLCFFKSKSVTYSVSGFLTAFLLYKHWSHWRLGVDVGVLEDFFVWSDLFLFFSLVGGWGWKGKYFNCISVAALL